MRSVISPFYSDEVVSSGGGGGTPGDDSITTAMLQNELATYAKLDPLVMRKATYNVSSVDITTNLSTGYIVVAAPGAGKFIRFLYGVMRYTWAVATYTGGGTGAFRYGNASAGAINTTITTSSYFGGTQSQIRIVRAITNTTVLSASGTTDNRNQPLLFSASSNFTNPGTAAGTAIIDVYHQIIDV